MSSSEKTTQTWLITGANRGIGLEFVRQLLSDQSNVVFATCRNPDAATDLAALGKSAQGRLHIFALDTSDPASISSAPEHTRAALGEQGLDYLLCSAAVVRLGDSVMVMSAEDMTRSFAVNVVGPALLAQAFLPLLERPGARGVIMNMSSGLGSIGLDCGPKCASYSVTKAALNMLTYKQAKEKPNLVSFVIDPGWVKTEMGGEGAVLEPEESVAGLLKVLINADTKISGKFLRYTGEELPW
ncbi:NAD(P)-binding protein [Peniophora sp. CONT]|nr:NAD(P)-binding protein [Peniophora sp. CONT]